MIEILQGDILYTPDTTKMQCLKNGYLVYENGIVIGVFDELSEEYKGCPITVYKDCLVIPGFNDIHVHAPQWINCGMGYSEELIPWLNTYTFPVEKMFESKEFAVKNYKSFVNALIASGTTRAGIFATIHEEATRILIGYLRDAGLGAYVGKVNMDRNSVEGLAEKTEESLYETENLINWVEETRKDNLVNYILTPRFVPSTTAALMTGLGKLAEKYQLKVQSHLSENKSEIAWVSELHPECESFAGVYYDYGLMPKGRTVMAHCVHNTQKEQNLLKKQEVLIAHCASSNANLSSGIMPLRKYMEEGQKIGLASDVGGGHTLNMRQHIIETIKASKLYWCINPEFPAVSFTEAFYLATKGGGSLFGKVGSFEKGYEMDALIISDENLASGKELTLPERLERFVYVGTNENIKKVFVHGQEITTY